MTDKVYLQNAISLEIIEVDVSDRKMPVALVTYLPSFFEVIGGLDYMELTREQYQKTSELFLAHPLQAEAKSAVLITDLTQLALSKEIIDTWSDGLKSEDVPTQKYLQTLFQRPVLGIISLMMAVKVSINDIVTEVNPEAEHSWYVGSVDEALELSQKLLRLAHRL